MSHYRLLITLSWIGSASLQYINSAGPTAESDAVDPHIRYPLAYMNYFNAEPANEFESRDGLQTLDGNSDADMRPITNGPRLRRSDGTNDILDQEAAERQWVQNLVDQDKTFNVKNDANSDGPPFMIQRIMSIFTMNNTDAKRSFSPWGGKRDLGMRQHTWKWKRSNHIREPSMPKRVRFSPWGGKRSTQFQYKPIIKGSRVIFTSAYLPELKKIFSRYAANNDLVDKALPFRILTLNSKLADSIIREALPFNPLIETQSKLFKAGHPYAEVTFKKDGKRKVKFSAWGGKKAPPIIGPIWTPPTMDNNKDSTLNAIILLRNSARNDQRDKTNDVL